MEVWREGGDGRSWVCKRATGREEAGRLRHEADLLRRAAHPGVVRLAGLEVDGDGSVTLRTVDAGCRDLATVGSLDLGAIVAVGAVVATTLADLHDLGLAHGAVRREHVILADDGQPVLCSLGRGGEVTALDPAQDVADLRRLLLGMLPATAPRRVQRLLVPGRVGLRRQTARELASGLARAVPTARLPVPGPAPPLATPTPTPGGDAGRADEGGREERPDGGDPARAGQGPPLGPATAVRGAHRGAFPSARRLPAVAGAAAVFLAAAAAVVALATRPVSTSLKARSASGSLSARHRGAAGDAPRPPTSARASPAGAFHPRHGPAAGVPVRSAPPSRRGASTSGSPSPPGSSRGGSPAPPGSSSGGSPAPPGSSAGGPPFPASSRRAAAPAGSRPSSGYAAAGVACPAADHDCRPVRVRSGRFSASRGRWSLDLTHVVVVVGRWTCGPVALPAALDRQRGWVWMWRRWARAGPVAARSVGRVSGATSLSVVPQRTGCDALEVHRPGRHPVLLYPGRP